jgi:2-dehydropantoate 2-reductase
MAERIAIIGSGALGCYYGAKLALGGAHVRFLMRSDLEAVRKRGSILIHEGSALTKLAPVAVFGRVEEMGAADLVIVTLKATANPELGRILPPLLGEGAAILTLQNGLGSDEEIARLFGKEKVMGGLAFIAASRCGPGEVKCFHPGSVTLGEFARPASDRVRSLAGQFKAAGVEARVCEDLMEARWHKLVWNIPFNGLSIAEGALTTDQICADPRLAGRVRALMKEVQEAAAAFGYSISDDFLRRQFDVTPPMGAYRPSSLVDFLAGREVEVEAIWGEPLSRARAKGLSLPGIAELHAKLQATLGSASHLRSGPSGR